MKTRKYSVSPVATTLLVFLVSGATATGMAQTTPPAPGKMPQPMEGMQGMGGMVGPHHVLAMAYRDNLATFAKALQGQVAHSKTVDLDLARPAVAEMRRSFDQMREHHQAQMQMMTMMRDSTKAPKAGTPQHMETHITALGAHLTALESEVNASTPDPKRVSEHTTEILKQSTGMSAMPAKATHPQME